MKLKLSQEYMGFEEEDDENKLINPQQKPTGNENAAQMDAWVEFLNSKQVIYNAALPGGGRTPILKTALSTGCERNCKYCAFRSGRDFRRIVYKPEELADFYMKLWQRKAVKGIFLSSGLVGGGIATQDRLIKTAEILRFKHHYSGYIHLKIMPSCEKAQVQRSMELADRVSINLEAPSMTFLRELAPQKYFMRELLQPLKWVDQIREEQTPVNAWKNTWPSSATQFVVGPAGEKDIDLLGVSDYLFNTLHLRRTFFSAFNPVEGTPFEEHLAEPFVRKLRLYQASYLLRDYHFALEDLPFTADQNLPSKIDPKKAWAEMHLKHRPTELNNANFEELLRVPGIGHKGARKIIMERRKNAFRYSEDLKAVGISPKRLLPYILLDGKRPNYQLTLW